MQRVGHASAGGALWSRLLVLRSQAGLRGRGGLEGRRAEASGSQSGPRPGSPHPLSTGPRPPALPTRTKVLAKAGKEGRTASGTSCAGQASAPPAPSLVPGDTSWREASLGLFGPHPTPRVPSCVPLPDPRRMCATSSGNFQGEKRIPRLKASHPRRSLGVPRSLAAPRAPPLQAWPGDGGEKALCRPVPGADGSGTCFLPDRGPLVSARGGQIQDPGSGSRIGSGPAPEAARRRGGCAGGSSPRRRRRRRAGGLAGGRDPAAPPAGGGLQWQPLRGRDARLVADCGAPAEQATPPDPPLGPDPARSSRARPHLQLCP